MFAFRPVQGGLSERKTVREVKKLKRQQSEEYTEGERNLILRKIVVIAIVVLLSFYVLDCVYAQPSPLQQGTMLQNEGGRFFHTPELWLGPILGLAGCFAALGVFYVSKRKHP
jgi:hypothetical protein